MQHPITANASPSASSSARSDVGARETERLIASDKVEGTSVRNPRGDDLGTIERVMIDKRSGRVAYAVMTFGGILGMGESYHAVPWSMLRYNESLDAYELDLTEDQLRNAPTQRGAGDFDWSDRDWAQRSHDYYGSRPFWDSGAI